MIQNIGIAAGGSVLVYGLLRTNTAGPWLSARVEVPVAMLIAMALLIIIPTGDLINTASKWLEYLAPPGDDSVSTSAGRPPSPRQVSQSHRHPNTPRRPVAGDGTRDHDPDRSRDRTQSQSSAPDGTDD